MKPAVGNRLRENIVALSVLQALNYVVPLVTVPYLVRVLGPAHFGMLAFAQALVAYLDLLTNYGFNLSATRSVACLRNDPAALAAAFWRTMYARLTLLIASAAILALLVASVPRFRATPMLYAGAFLTVGGSVAFPVWFFQGIERMRLITIAHASARLLTIPALVFLVRAPHDVVRAAIIQGSVPVLASALLLPAARRVVSGRPPGFRLAEIRRALSEGWHAFLAQSGLVMNLSTTTVILGLVAGNAEVGYYSAADKVIRAVTSMLGPIAQALYPHLNSLKTQSPAEMSRIMRKSFAWIVLLASGASLATFALARLAGMALWGPEFGRSVAILRCLAPLPLLLALINIMGTQTMLVFEMDAALSRIVLAGCIANALFAALGAAAFGGLGAAAAAVCAAALVAAGLARALDGRFPLRRLSLRPACAP
jgi:polysaccharide transporter, PST family